MKIIIGIFDRQVSCRLAVVLSGRKIVPIEAESIEEIPALLSRHRGAVLLTEEINPNFYHSLKERSPETEIFLLAHRTLTAEQINSLRFCGLRGLIPYTENETIIADTLLKYLSLLADTIKKEEKNHPPVHTLSKDVGVYLPSTQAWVYGSLVGFNSSKVAVSFDTPDLQYTLHHKKDNKILVYLQGLKIKAQAETVYGKQNLFVFRYCYMSAEDQEKLSYYLHYCNQNHGSTAVL